MSYFKKVKSGTRVVIKSLDIEIKGDDFTPQKTLKRVYDAGFIKFVGKRREDKDEEE